MQSEKIAVITLAIIIICALSIFVGANYSQEIMDALFPEEKVIEYGDCADVNYIGRLTNGTVFDSSYKFYENKTGGNPLKIFVTMDKTLSPPTEYPQYSSGMIDGFIEGLVGLKEGETATIGPIPPEKAYGERKLSVGDTFTTFMITYSNLGYGFNQTVEVTKYDEESMILKWIDAEGLNNFTLPEGILMEDLENAYYTIYENAPPFYLWENATQVINITDDYLELKINPTASENITNEISFLTIGTQLSAVFPDATTASWDDDTVTITSNPVENSVYNLNYMDTELLVNIDKVTDEHINVTIEVQGQNQSASLNRTISFSRTYNLRTTYIIPPMFESIFEEDIVREGFSLHDLAGEELLFEVTIESVYKTSQEN